MAVKHLKGVLKQIMPSYIILLPKLELDTLELLFYTYFVCVSSRKLQNPDRTMPYFRFKCVRKCIFAHMVATPTIVVIHLGVHCLPKYRYPFSGFQYPKGLKKELTRSKLLGQCAHKKMKIQTDLKFCLFLVHFLSLSS